MFCLDLRFLVRSRDYDSKAFARYCCVDKLRNATGKLVLFFYAGSTNMRISKTSTVSLMPKIVILFSIGAG